MRKLSSTRSIYKKIPILTMCQSEKQIIHSQRMQTLFASDNVNVNVVTPKDKDEDADTTLSSVSNTTQSKVCFSDYLDNNSITPLSKCASKPSLTPCVSSQRLIFVKKKIPLKRNQSPRNHINNSNNSNSSKHEYKINLEELILLESKLNEIVHKIMIGDIIILSKACVDWWNFYFHCSLNGGVDHYYIDVYSKDIIRFYSSITFFAVMLVYDLCFHVECLNKVYQEKLTQLMELLQMNFIIVCDYIFSKVDVEFAKGNFWVGKLRSLLLAKDIANKLHTTRIEQIKRNNTIAYEYLTQLVNKISKDKHVTMNKQLSKLIVASIYVHHQEQPNMKLTKDFINNFFINKVLIYQTNTNGSILSTAQTKQSSSTVVNNSGNNTNSSKPSIPYITTQLHKRLTLVLDLDETLVNVKISKTNSNQGCLLFRPGLDDFLEHLSEWYEIVIFTAATKDYADAILDEIDLNGNLFTYRLYREHTTIIGNDYVKDISLIGRDLDKTVIVDNMAQNFKLQKENGILIHSFWGDDEYDVALIELEKILRKVAQEKGDIRVILKKYKEDILKKVSSKLFWDDNNNSGC